MLKHITHYKEFGSKEGGNVKDNSKKKAISGKPEILVYLYDGKFIKAIYCGLIYDYILDTYTNLTKYRYSDGEYVWDSEVAYHFEKYNIELEKGFVEKVLK